MSQVRDEIEAWLKTIKGVTCFTEKMKVYAPTCYGKCLDAVEELIAKINEIFTGSTVYDAEGTWVTPEGRVEREPVKVIEVGHRCTDPDSARRFAEAIITYAQKADQRTIAIYQNDFYIAQRPEMVEAFKKLKEKLP
jgi:cystathionine beta-lyase family protein involved in aluminum resistance